MQLGSLYSFTPGAIDADGDVLTFSIGNKPSWAQFDSSSGRLRGTPTANSHVGSSSVIRISVSDGRASVSLYFRITVTPPPATEPPATEPPVTEPPVIEPPVIEPPVTPPPSDDLVSAAQPSEYRWETLAPGKRVYVDRVYEFATIPAEYVGWRYLQTRNDDKYFAEPDRVRFSVSEPVRVIVGFDRRITILPEWAQSFTPTGETVQTTDARFDVYRRDFPAGTVMLGGNEMGRSNYTVALAPLTEVDDPVAPPNPSEPPTASGTASLTWDAPVLNEDGSQLRDLAGFRVRWGRAPGQWENSKALTNPDLTTYMVEGLTSGEWFFTVIAFDYSGNESREADIVSTVIQ